MFEEKEERKRTFWHREYWKQWMISDQVWRMGRGFSQTQHNEHNGSFLTCHSDPTCSLPRRDNGSGGPHFLCGSGGGTLLFATSENSKIEQKFNKINSQGEIYPQMRERPRDYIKCTILLYVARFKSKKETSGKTGLFMGSWPVIKDLIGFCFFTIFLSRNGPSRRLNNNRNTSALMPERGKTPPSNVNHPPLLIWAEGNHILVPESHQTILHPIMPNVSIVSCQFPRLEASQNTCLGSGDHYLGRMIMFLFFFFPSTEVSKFFF